MKKEKLDIVRFDSRYRYGTHLSKESLTPSEFEAMVIVADEAKDVFLTYMNDQNNFNLSYDNSKNKYVIENLSDVVELVSRVYNMNNADVHMQAANHYDNRKASPCADLFILNGHLNGYAINKKNGHSEENIKKATEIVKEQQEKFKNYKFGSTKPVDEESDLFASYVTPMLLAMHGYKVDKGFVDCLVSELNKTGKKLPDGLKNLRNGTNVKDLTQVDASQKEREEKIKNLRVVFDYLKIEEIYDEFIEKKKNTTLLRLDTAIKGFVPGIYDREDIEELDTSDDIKELISLYYMIYNDLMNEEDKEYIEKKFNVSTTEEKQTPEGLLLIAEYLAVKGIETFTSNKSSEEEVEQKTNDKDVAHIEPTVQVDNEMVVEEIVKEEIVELETQKEEQPVVENKKEQETTQEEQGQVNKVEVVEQVQDAEVSEVKEEKEVETDNNIAEQIVKETKRRVGAEKTTNEQDEVSVEPVVEEKKVEVVKTVLPKNLPGLEVVDYADMLFNDDRSYNLFELSQIPVETITRVCGKEIKKTEYPFASVMDKMVEEVVDGKTISRMMTLEEAYRQARYIFCDLDEGVRTGLLNHLGYVDKVNKQVDALINTYANIDDSQKVLLERLAINNEEIKAKLENKKANFDKEQQEASIRKERDLKIVKDIMNKYDIELPEQLSDEQVNESIADFCREVL